MKKKNNKKFIGINEIYEIYSELKDYIKTSNIVHEESNIIDSPMISNDQFISQYNQIDEKQIENVENLENPDIYNLSDNSEINIKYFMDGIQRTLFLGYIFNDELKEILPLNYLIAGSIILKLERKHLKVFDQEITSNLIIPPKKVLSKEIKSIISNYNYIEISEDDYKWCKSTNRSLQHFISKYAGRERMELEANIVHNFNKKCDDWIIIDGPLTSKNIFQNEKFLDSTKKVGIIKRQLKHYFNSDLEYEMLISFYNKQLKDSKINRRSWKFSFNRQINGESIDIVSCYTKLFFTNPDPYFSLLRIEVLKEYETLLDDILTVIQRLKIPSSQPSNVWDKKIYPIKICEEVLKSKVPSIHLIKNIFNERS